MNLIFRFTLDNDTEGELEIHEPDGWDDASLKLERDKDYHSLIEFYDQALLFDDAIGNGLPGGLSYITNIQYTQGPDAQITLTIEISEDDGETYETFFEGILDIPTTKETDFYKLECGIKRNNFWSKFFNRKSIPVDLKSTTDLDGGARAAIDSFELPLPSQVINQRYSAKESDSEYLIWENTEDFIQVGFDEVMLDEIKDRFQLISGTSTTIPVWIFEILYDGEYEINYSIETSVLTPLLVPPFENFTVVQGSDYMQFKLKINNDDPIFFSETDVTNDGDENDPDFTRFTYFDTHNFSKGDIIRIYAEGSVPFTLFALIWGETSIFMSEYPGVEVVKPTGSTGSTADISGDTTYTDTQTDAFVLRDAARSILSRIVSRDDVLYSNYLGDEEPFGCGLSYAVMKGLHVRGYTFANKPFAMSFDQWWTGANPILNLGLGYETILGTEYIRIEKKGYFYDKTPALNLDFVNSIERSYNLDYIFKAIEIGYNKWSAESASGVDDPQTKRTWRTRFGTVGRDEKILSIFIAASLAIEQTRRNRVEQGNDWRLDEDIIIIALNEAADAVELDENFDLITNLLNEDSRYNNRLTCGHNFRRWLNYFNGCLQVPASEVFTFASGEGNYDMTSTLSDTDCEGTDPTTNINEKGNVDVTDDFLFIPIVYQFEHPLSFSEYTTIRDNRTKAIGVSREDSDHKACFIMSLDYKPTHGLGIFTVMLGENDPI